MAASREHSEVHGLGVTVEILSWHRGRRNFETKSMYIKVFSLGKDCTLVGNIPGQIPVHIAIEDCFKPDSVLFLLLLLGLLCSTLRLFVSWAFNQSYTQIAIPGERRLECLACNVGVLPQTLSEHLQIYQIRYRDSLEDITKASALICPYMTAAIICSATISSGRISSQTVQH